ncbi:MAG TPA: hypothetical protein VLM37_08055, partial [Fibrobacteraceae bacterium]|nr:hypothetical protein [Fibrobacteraceae bacterium]
HTRKSLLTLIEGLMAVMTIILVTAAFIGFQALETNFRLGNAEVNLRLAGDQLEAFKLGEASSQASLQLHSLSSLSSLPNGRHWNGVRDALEKLQTNLNSLLLSNDAWLEERAKNRTTFLDLQKEVQDHVNSNRAAELAQKVWMAAQAIKDWMDSPPQDTDMHLATSRELQGLVAQADSLLSLCKTHPEAHGLNTRWDLWINSTYELLLEEKTFRQQEKLTNTSIGAYTTLLDRQALEWLEQVRTSMGLMIGLFMLLLATTIWALQSLKKNPHLNLMLSRDPQAAMQASLAEITRQVDNILSSVDRAWINTRSELKGVHHAMSDSQTMDDQVRQLKSSLESLLHETQQSLQALEQRLRSKDELSANQTAATLALVQTQGSRLQQFLDLLGESSMSLYTELELVHKSIRSLMSGTLALRREGENLEESSSSLQTESN